MIELTVGVVLGWGAHALFTHWKRKIEPAPLKRYYFNEDYYFKENPELRTNESVSLGDLYFFTVAEFSEDQVVRTAGLVKQLGFSDYPVLFDYQADRIMKASVTFIGTDCYDKGPVIGYFSLRDYLDHQLGELTVRFTLAEYDSLFEKLKQSAETRSTTGERMYFLYKMHARIFRHQTEENTEIKGEIRDFELVSSCSEKSVEGISVMRAIKEGADSTNAHYRSLCRDYLYRYSRLINPDN